MQEIKLLDLKYNSSKVRRSKRIELIELRGLQCEDCHAVSNKKGQQFSSMNTYELAVNLVLHEKDGNKKNLINENLLLLCKSCNGKSVTKTGGFTSRRWSPEMINALINKAEPSNYIHTHKETEIDISFVALNRNRIGIPALKNWLNEKLLERGALRLDYCLVNGSAIAGVQKITMKKWLEILTCDVEAFRIRKIKEIDFIMLKETAIEFDKELK